MAFLSEPHAPDESGLPPPRFSLRALLIVVTLLCCLFAFMATLNTFSSVMLLLFLMLVLAHVVGTSLGTRLTAHTNQQIAAAKAARPTRTHERVEINVAAPQRLRQRTRVNRLVLVLTAAGAVAGADLGGVGAAALYPQSTAAAVSLGVASAAVLGGLAGFLAGSFFTVLQQALAEAHRGATAPPRAQTSKPPR